MADGGLAVGVPAACGVCRGGQAEARAGRWREAAAATATEQPKPARARFGFKSSKRPRRRSGNYEAATIGRRRLEEGGQGGPAVQQREGKELRYPRPELALGGCRLLGVAAGCQGRRAATAGEVQIDYWANGEVVEIAGSFNGWQHRIKMDLDPSSQSTNPSVSRQSLHWTTILWLYPGVYEIKFIVDGNWRTDSRREIVTSGNITNNVLRVDQ
uniref:AMP-activated protein kinase glycogen-binding domain-containing protein n=1 Tax=Ananas comosus var. bracteatus TaxID=296719 RepID=A0A6V7PY99_ANACO|nr:unnamed protein product [Ananas comosus var. bracteatus]